MSALSLFEKETRKIFGSHHEIQTEDDALFSRLVSLVSEEYFGFEKGFFEGKTILDAGCGSNANASFGFLSVDAKKVVSMDMGREWQACAEKRLGVFGDRSKLMSGSVLDLPFDGRQFDFVHCAGVLHHTSDPYKGFQNLAGVVKPGGWVFITIMANGDGLIYKIINHVRELYKQDKNLRDRIDSLDKKQLEEGLGWLINQKNKSEKEYLTGENEFFKSLFDVDLILTIKDRIQAPTYWDFDFTEEELRGWYSENKLTNVKRLTRYTKGFKNLRRFFAPMYNDYDDPMSRFWFGEGYVQLIGQKL